jgi:hypothetical protein
MAAEARPATVFHPPNYISYMLSVLDSEVAELPRPTKLVVVLDPPNANQIN